MSKNIYLERYAFKKAQIAAAPPPDLGIIVVIPSYKEPDVLVTLDSIAKCKPCHCAVEVIVVLNFAESDCAEVKSETGRQHLQLKEWSANHNSNRLTYHVIIAENIKDKNAGPGMARKIGMDEAVRRFEKTGNKKGVIANLDADCTVAENYLAAIYNHWEKFPNTNGVSIFFEHPVKGNYEKKILRGITDYELHLRYYVNAQRFAGFPYARQTVGSSFAVTSEAYQKQGGMNKRKAGEDFYFMHKIIPLGQYYNLNDTTVYPSPRPSNRVPFGTGRTISDYMKTDEELTTYNIQSFMDLKKFLEFATNLYSTDADLVHRQLDLLPESIREFLNANGFISQLHAIKSNASQPATFTKGFFRWFDAFKVMKFVHFARDRYYQNQPVHLAAKMLLSLSGIFTEADVDAEKLLVHYRKLDRLDVFWNDDFTGPISG